MSEKKPQAILLCGLPCTGKTTWVKKHEWPAVYLSSDAIIESMARREDMNYMEAFDEFQDQAFKLFDFNLDRAIAEKQDIIWDQTNLSVEKREKCLELLKDYDVMVVAFEAEDDEIARRLEKREKETGKIIPQETLEEMRESYVRPSMKEGFSQVHLIKSPSGEAIQLNENDDGPS